jgi:leucyl aminopeptidase (aminopeptidase T)
MEEKQMTKAREIAISYILTECGGISISDRVLILCDSTTKDISNAFTKISKNKANFVQCIEIPKLISHGQEPPTDVVDEMCQATLIISLCRYSLAHSQARIDSATAGARFLSLPLYNWDLLDNPCVQVNYKAQASIVHYFANAFTEGNIVHVTSFAGTDLTIGINQRIGNYCPGFVENAGDLGSPPDIEANISPLETSAQGKIVVDGSITCPELGLLTTPVILSVSQGKVVSVSSERMDYVKIIESMLGELDSPRRVVAECGVGLNPLALLTGSMLTDEGTLGCVHFGLGANNTVGGNNKVDFHLDFVVRSPNLSIDGSFMIKQGIIC